MVAHNGFNPCCLGLAVLACQACKDSMDRRAFQSLLSWISCIGRKPSGYPSSPNRFQSLLSWISCIGLIAPAVNAAVGYVSILVVLD